MYVIHVVAAVDLVFALQHRNLQSEPTLIGNVGNGWNRRCA
jgi:hypothetical protein